MKFIVVWTKFFFFSMICSSDRSCFPWTLNIKDLSCYTIQNGSKMECLKPCSLNATIGLSTKNSKPDEDSLSKDNSSMSTTSMSKNDISSLGVCVHVDMTPVFISTCELQVQNSFVLRSVCLVFFFWIHTIQYVSYFVIFTVNISGLFVC